MTLPPSTPTPLPSPLYVCHVVGSRSSRFLLPEERQPLVHVVADQPWRKTVCGKTVRNSWMQAEPPRQQDEVTCPACVELAAPLSASTAHTDGAT